MRSIAFILLISYSITQLYAQSTITDVDGNELANCECNCCSGETRVQQDSVLCNVDLVILISAAACVKDYVNQIKGRASQMIDEFLPNADRLSPYAGHASRVGIISYSTDTVNIHELDQSVDDIHENLANWDYTQQLNGDMLGKGLEAAYNMFSSSSRGSKRAMIVITNGGVNDKQRDQDVSKYTTKLRQMGVDIMAHTITEHCDVKKDCLMCCPDKHFLTSVLATSDRVCDNSFKSFDEDLGQDVRRYESNNYYRQCLENIVSQCKGQRQLDGDSCHRSCDCTCRQVRRGIPGLPGAKGTPGLNGRQGNPGQDGQDGLSGMPGVPGNAGADGRPGEPCINGQAAPNGRQGPAGRPGSAGPRGVDGTQGERGITGPVGHPGAKGTVGRPGAPGPEGNQGPRGAQGPQGDKGEPGSQGCPGAQGKAGEDGKNGATGPRGADGEQGPQGVKGPAGKPGMPGLCGDAGDAGAPGLNGEPGVAGHDGRQGAAGERGDKGVKGKPGKAGRMDYSNYVAIIREEILVFLNNYGWRFTGHGKARPVTTTTTTTFAPETTPVPMKEERREGCQNKNTADDSTDHLATDLDALEEILNIDEPQEDVVEIIEGGEILYK